MAGDLIERELAACLIRLRARTCARRAQAVLDCENERVQAVLDCENERTRRAAMSPVQRRNVRRAELYQQRKRARLAWLDEVIGIDR